jgi:hypothetical protein
VQDLLARSEIWGLHRTRKSPDSLAVNLCVRKAPTICREKEFRVRANMLHTVNTKEHFSRQISKYRQHVLVGFADTLYPPRSSKSCVRPMTKPAYYVAHSLNCRCGPTKVSLSYHCRSSEALKQTKDMRSLPAKLTPQRFLEEARSPRCDDSMKA